MKSQLRRVQRKSHLHKIIKRIRKHLEEINSNQKPQLENYSYQQLKKVLYIYNLRDDKDENENI
jgi:ribosome-binding ATPase YchF (GTP1/OBG family)